MMLHGGDRKFEHFSTFESKWKFINSKYFQMKYNAISRKTIKFYNVTLLNLPPQLNHSASFVKEVNCIMLNALLKFYSDGNDFFLHSFIECSNNWLEPRGMHNYHIYQVTKTALKHTTTIKRLSSFFQFH